jgi:RecB family exonuclease
LRGVIDRMDRIRERVVIIDYKSGSTKIPKAHIEQGRNFQMLVYLTAAQALASGVEGGLFWHISDRATSGDLSPADPVIDAGAAHIKTMLAAGRAGRFYARANGMEGGKCAHTCDFSQFCRVSLTNQEKADDDAIH